MVSTFLLTFMAFFAIMNPIANLPTYMALVADDDAKISKQIAFKSLLIAFVIVLVFILSGHLIFEVFGITISAFRIAGGFFSWTDWFSHDQWCALTNQQEPVS